MNTWHYEKDGQRLGPLPEDELKPLIENGSISAKTLVWSTGLAGWTPLVDTALAIHLLQVSTPPALPASKVSNTITWVLAFAPLLGFFLKCFLVGATAGDEDVAEAIRSGQFWYVTLLLNIGLSLLDLKTLQRAGVDTKAYGKMVWVVPVYLWKRAKSLGQSPAYFWVWMGMFILTQLAVASS